MIRTLFLASWVVAATASAGLAEGRERLGNGRLVNNDLFYKNLDRWQSGSAVGSHVVGYGWDGALPDRPFDLIEYRLQGRVISPASLTNPEPGDRPFAGVLGFGVHTHFGRGAIEYALGADLFATGEMTGMDDLQEVLHDGLGIASTSKDVRENQIENGWHATVLAEAGRSFALSDHTVVRPFMEGQAGLETFARVGADVTIGAVGQGELMVRESVTGQRYRAVQQQVPGFSYVAGADVAWVEDSALLPKSKGVEAEDTRYRLRTGVHWQGERNAVFYGMTYLSEEFKAQNEGQVIGSVRLNVKF